MPSEAPARSPRRHADGGDGSGPHAASLRRSASILVLALHRGFRGAQPPREWFARLRAARPDRRIVVEAARVDEAGPFADPGGGRVQRAHLAPERLAAAGADLLVTSAPYAAPPIDVKVALAEG